jgi:hypothetical protein
MAFGLGLEQTKWLNLKYKKIVLSVFFAWYTI